MTVHPARLVRSRALENWRVAGAEHQVREPHSETEYDALLIDKLREEVEELIDALITGSSKGHVKEEFGDVLSVLDSLVIRYGLDRIEVRRQFHRKDESHGRFDYPGALVWDRNIGE